MKIGIPKALLYHRYGRIWETFFDILGCQVVTSGDTSRQTLARGAALADSECCLPVKIFLGHAEALRHRCDAVLVPRFERTAGSEEFCVRFWGLPDVTRATFPDLPMLVYDLRGRGGRGEMAGLLRLGGKLRFGPAQSLRAYRLARQAQRWQDLRLEAEQRALLDFPGIKLLLAGQAYLVHDAWAGVPVARILREQGAAPLFADRCDRSLCRSLSRNLSEDLYWTLNKEVLGAVQLLKDKIDGVILLSSFPCGTDSLANELALRRIKDIPVSQIILDEHQGEAGLQTRIESFLDIIRGRRGRDAS